MRIISFDLSTKSSGSAIFDGDKLIKSCIIAHTSTDVLIRINYITTEIAKLLDEYKPKKAYLEEVLPATVGNNIETYRKLTWIQGFVINELHKRGIPHEFVVASHWRKEVGIKTGIKNKRGNLKEQSIALANELFNLQTKNDDLADAVMLGWSQVKNNGGMLFS